MGIIERGISLIKKWRGIEDDPSVQKDVVIAGHKFTVLNPMKMPKIRQAAIYLGEYERDWGMTKEDLLSYDDVLCKNAKFPVRWIDKDDLVHQLTEKMKLLYSLIDTRRLLIQEDFQYKPFLKAAAHMILLDDEDPTKIESEYMVKKMKLCKDHEEVLLFFLTIIRNFQKNTLTTLGTSPILEYYPPTHITVMERKILNEIQSTIFYDGNT